MQVLNCLIVEDEPLAADILIDYIHQLNDLKLVGVCDNVWKATEKLREQRVDIIFLDINLPKINGLDFLKTIHGKYSVILTTAYHQYALEGFNLDAIDYLLKPIEFSRFLQAIHKIYDKGRMAAKGFAKEEKERRHYFFNAGKKKIKVFADQILYIESMKDYVWIHTLDQKIMTKFQIGEMEKLLEHDPFIRIHKSYIVNAEKITAYNAISVEVQNTSLPIGRTYKEIVERMLQ